MCLTWTVCAVFRHISGNRPRVVWYLNTLLEAALDSSPGPWNSTVARWFQWIQMSRKDPYNRHSPILQRPRTLTGTCCHQHRTPVPLSCTQSAATYEVIEKIIDSNYLNPKRSSIVVENIKSMDLSRNQRNFTFKKEGELRLFPMSNINTSYQARSVVRQHFIGPHQMTQVHVFFIVRVAHRTPGQILARFSFQNCGKVLFIIIIREKENYRV